MRKILLLAGMAAFIYTGARLMLRRPAEAPSAPEEPAPTPEERPVLDPFAASSAAPEEPAPAPEPESAPAPAARPNVRALKVADVPAPGAQRTPEEAARVAAIDAAARDPRLTGYAGSPGYSAGTAPSYRAPDIPRGAATPSEEAPGSPGAPARRVARKGGAAAPAVAKPGAKPPAASGEETPPSNWNQALVVINDAKGFSPGEKKAEMRAAMELSKDPVGQQFLADQQVGAGVRSALTSLRSKGRPTTLEEEKRVVADALSAAGVEPVEDEVNLQLALADAPQPPPISAQEALSILERMRAAPDQVPLTEFPHPPFPGAPEDDAEEEEQGDPDEAAPRRTPAERPRLPPPPGNARRAYDMTRNALERAQQRWGVAPEHPLAIFWQETNFGRFLGGGPVAASLRREVENSRPGSARYRQAVRDQAALVRLEASGELGRYNASNIIGSSPGASFGYTQFRPSSYEAYGRSASGGRRDPFNANDAVYSSANYLQIHGYRRDPARAFWHYNHDPSYVRAVQNKGTRIRQHVIDPAGR